MTSLAAVLVLGYLSGSLPWGLWLGRWLRGVDVRTLGSRNLGATNVYRTLGPGIGVAVLLLDIAKGALPVWLVPGLGVAAGFPGGAEWCRIVVGLAAVLGSILGSLAFAATLGFVAPGGWRSPKFAVGVVIALLVVLRHKDNIARLLKGEERRFSFKGGSS